MSVLPINTRHTELQVLSLIALGLIIIILAIVLGLFLDNNGLPNWAENVLVSVATACALKLGDCINALIALSTGRQVEAFGTKLAEAGPPQGEQQPAPQTAQDAADRTADAAQREADKIAGAER